VTGGNKGIGFEAVRGFCRLHPDWKIILTARDSQRGNDAVERLAKDGLVAIFHQLDIDDVKSIHSFAKVVKENYGGIDILINNAGMAFKRDAKEPFAVQAKETMRINYTGTVEVMDAMLPLLRDGSSIVNVASSMGVFSFNELRKDLQQLVVPSSTTRKSLDTLLEGFLLAAEENRVEASGWPVQAYGVSKLGVIIVTEILAGEISKKKEGKRVILNSCCPGWCKSDMAGWEKPPKTASEGADILLYTALGPHGKTGCFLSENEAPEGIPFNTYRIKKDDLAALSKL